MPGDLTTAYLIADGARARLVLRRGPKQYDTIRELEAPHVEPPREDERVRLAPRIGVGSAIDSITPRQQARRDFLVEVAKVLNETAAELDADQIVLVAPPRTLAALKARLDPAVARQVRGQLAKDLTKLPELDLREALERWEGRMA